MLTNKQVNNTVREIFDKYELIQANNKAKMFLYYPDLKHSFRPDICALMDGVVSYNINTGAQTVGHGTRTFFMEDVPDGCISISKITEEHSYLDTPHSERIDYSFYSNNEIYFTVSILW